MAKRKEKKADTDKSTKQKARLEEVAEKLRQLGLEDPESWARVEVNEGIPLLAKFYFLKLMWNGIIKEGDMKWIDRDIEIAEKHLDAPFIGGGLALKSLRAKGATDEELNDLVRNYQMQYMWDIIMVLEQGNDPLGKAKLAWQEQIEWVLVQVNKENRCLGFLEGLCELMMALDPTGRSCRIRGWVNK